jgi:midasin
MTVVDGLGALPTTAGLTRDGLDRLRTACYRRLETLVPLATAPESTSLDVVDADNTFYVGSFGVSKGPLLSATVDYTLQAPTTRLNAMRLLRALQLTKPVLLEGSPGVGKTSLVTAIAAATGHNLIRINLSDQTDLMDLLGSDLPVEGGRSGEFAWKDAPFLAAMQEGAWVLLDEMNLASQSILEGLNSCLDHRGTVYIPELDRTFTRHPEFRIFAAQNPLGQGGGRKGLPKSFLDRFSIVHMEELNSTDLNAIASALFPDVDAEVLRKMIAFNSSIHLQTMQSHSFGMEGAPWEFNLRDVLRWLALLRSSSGLDLRAGEPVEYVGLLYVQRFRNLADRNHVARLFAEAFSESLAPSDRPWPSIGPHSAQIGHSLVHRADQSFNARQINFSPLLQRSLQPMEALVKCLEMGWLAILTGTRSSGKTTLVRQLASYEGRTLREFSMNAEVDTLELLGSFEQAERFREVDRIALEVLQIVHEALREQLHSTTTVDLHSHITTLEHLREVLGDSASEFDPIGASTIIHAALTLVSATSAGAASQAASIWSRLEAAATAAPPTARFEWIDGPLVQAMKNGDWLLIEDANLCSPSVLDRLNSLFEPGGRLQLAERGPVNGEIQIIFPHPNFRLVMTLDPRHGELSRAMRNRGIEIALIPAEPTEEDQRRLAAFSRTSSSTSAGILSYAALVDGSSTAPAAELPPLGFIPDELREPTLAPVLATASLQLLSPDLDPVAFARHLLGVVATSHYGIMVRFLRTMELLDGGAVESSIHRLGRHSLVRQIGEAKEAYSTSRAIPLSLVRLQVRPDLPSSHRIDSDVPPPQPTDFSLNPHAESTASYTSLLSLALDTLTAQLLSTSAQPETLRIVSAKPARSLSVWEKSLLASKGKLRMDEADPAMVSLYPVSASLAALVNHMMSLELLPLEESYREVSLTLRPPRFSY